MNKNKFPDKWLICSNIKEWHLWLASHNDKEKAVWLQIKRAKSKETGIVLNEAVEEAICYGWIDGMMYSLDSDKYILRMTHRRNGSMWSMINRKRAERMIEEGRMTEAGMVTVKEAQENGRWQTAYSSKELPDIPEDLKNALQIDTDASCNFESWSNSQKLQAVVWIEQSRQQESRIIRINKIVSFAHNNQNLEGKFMDKEKFIKRLKAKPDSNELIAETSEDSSVLNLMFDIVSTETSTIKYTCTKIIRRVSEQKPELIYPYFEEIVKWLHNDNSFIKWDGIMTMSNLVAVDSEDKFDAIFQEYFALIKDPHMITAANVIGNAWKIVIARPELESDITKRLLEVQRITYMNKGEPSPECNRIACGQVIECFEQYFDQSSNQAAMIAFAEEQLASCRKSVAKIASKFLKKHSGK